jgi:hypothetical protein
MRPTESNLHAGGLDRLNRIAEVSGCCTKKRRLCLLSRASRFYCSIVPSQMPRCSLEPRGRVAPDIVRVRIIRRLTGSVDGIELTPFQPGVVYDLSTTLGSYLLCVRVAEPAPDDSPAFAMPLGRVRTAADDLGPKPPAKPGAEGTGPPQLRDARRSRPPKRR